ncbi:hypothetical protein IQ250_18590 [Pseudanabaenaceae cyanobacterium LEGE 13415]|nr:hypothetical protein [Pseudanabaenaceae cyanobacterium LEGE 13415]
MNSDKANEISHKFESLLSAMTPEIAQLIQQYSVSGTIDATLKTATETITSTGCVYRPPGGASCTSLPSTILEIFPEVLQFGETSDSDPAEQFWMNLASILFKTMIVLEQSIQETDESFEVHFAIDTAKVNCEQLVVCQWDSNSSQTRLLTCSMP